MDVDLSGRVIAVTGGTRGIGRAAVRKLCASGATVYFQGRSQDAADETVALAEASGTRPTFVPGDLARYESVDDLCRRAVEEHGRLDGAVGSGTPRAGTATWSLFRETAPEDLADGHRYIAEPRIFLAHAAARHMAPAGYGKIVLLTSDGGRIPTPAETLVGSSAAGVIFLARALGRELARDGIRVNCLAVTLTLGTAAHDRFGGNRGDQALEQAFAKIEARAPFGLGGTEEAANLVAFLLAPDTDGISGATLSVNRGAYFPAYA